ncbi:GntR family transcriptional regulator [Kaarinaea lacus]
MTDHNNPTNASITTLTDRVFQILSREIVEGTIPAGSKISEPELSRRLNVSRASLREAISRLESCNLVTRKANVGARVAELSNEQLIEIYHIREALEGVAARQAAENMTEDEVDGLKALLKQHTDDFKRADGTAYFQKDGDLDFHFRIVQGSHNQRLISLLCNDLYHQMRMYRYQLGMTSRRAGPALKEHSLIVDAIADGDGEMAELLMRRHVRASRLNIERLFAQEKVNQGQVEKEQEAHHG